jgi:chaperonin GroEL
MGKLTTIAMNGEMVGEGNPMTSKQKTPRVVFQPTAYQGVQRGINQMVEAVCPTLGPLPRTVAIEQVTRARMPELLDDGGVIARRIIELADRDEDVGAMFLCHVLWRLHEKVGDGTATAAVLFQSVYNQGVRYVVAGGNAMVLRHYLERGMGIVLVEGQTAPILRPAILEVLV